MGPLRLRRRRQPGSGPPGRHQRQSHLHLRFITCSTLAAVGGLLGAARLAAANQGSGTGDVNLNAIAAAVIGGTSLFGGRGSAFAAILGIIVIQSISSGLTLLNLDSSFRFMVTGVVLLLAVMLDSVARRSRTSHGRA